jgi:hypothetical protein
MSADRGFYLLREMVLENESTPAGMRQISTMGEAAIIFTEGPIVVIASTDEMADAFGPMSDEMADTFGQEVLVVPLERLGELGTFPTVEAAAQHLIAGSLAPPRLRDRLAGLCDRLRPILASFQ